MVQLLIAYDHADPDEGPYFYSCCQDLQSYAAACGTFQVSELDSNHNEINLQDAITSFEGKPFIFAAFTHGKKDAIIMAEAPFVHSKNAYYFGKSMVYTCACKVGQELAGLLKHHQCRAFIGFYDDGKLPPTVKIYDSFFQECEMSGLKSFMEGNMSIQESYEFMKNTYTEKFDELVQINPGAAWLLLVNRDALLLDATGNEHLKLIDFY